MAFYVLRNDICRMEVDAIVNAANETLQHGGGVAWSIAQAAGWGEMAEASAAAAPCPAGSAVYTPGFALPADYVIHTVGPIWQGGEQGEAQLLASAYESALVLAVELGCKSVAFPLISAGVYGYPRDEAFQIALDSIDSFLEQQRACDCDELDVYLVLYDESAAVCAEKFGLELDEFIDDAYVQEQDVLKPRSRSREARRRRLEEPMVCGAAGAVDTEMDAAAVEAVADAAVMEAPSLCGDFAAEFADACEPKSPDLSQWLTGLDASFSETVLSLIDAQGWTDAQVYKRVNMSRQAFAKLRKPGYHPKKSTAIILALALELTLDQTQDLLGRAGYTLSRAFPQDVVVMFFIMNEIYDLAQINLALFQRDLPLLGL